jgi:hypothetical protein
MFGGRHGPTSAVIAPPEPGAPSAAEAEALFAEAHRRRRRRRLVGGVACLLLAGSAAAGLMTAWPGDGAGTHHELPGAAPRAPGFMLPPVRVAWVDYSGQLHIGDLATGTQQVVATIDASPADPVIVAGGRLYWADGGQNAAPVREYDIATGKIRYLPRGNSVFTSADGRHLYIVQTGTRLIELPADGIGAPRQLTLPAAWHASGLLGNWSVAGGIVVYSSDADPGRHPVALAVWNPATGSVKVIGRDLDVIDVYTPPGAGYSLLAWTPADCPQHCPVGIINTSTLASLTVPSPNRYGFTYGGLFTSGAFSPDGTRLAVFLNTTDPHDPYHEPLSELAIVNTRTGALQLVGAARLGTSEDVGWARWLPGGHQLIVGAEEGSYAVDAETLAVREFSFGPANDINFSATVLPAP